MTDPLAGEGLFFAAKSAELAVEDIKKAFEKNNFTAEGLSTYWELLEKKNS